MITPVSITNVVYSALSLNNSINVPVTPETPFGRDLVTFSATSQALSQSRARGGMPDEWSDNWSPDKIRLSLFRGTMASRREVFQKYTANNIYDATSRGLASVKNWQPDLATDSPSGGSGLFSHIV
ncbi:MAG: hypothetical protein HQL63_09360 [Magnetococcales bacterium]|nr:hypothetical protein [Magnetococcales bacterium]MBF0323382.1 hypothetical protein [Magnetococcales bacterium]